MNCSEGSSLGADIAHESPQSPAVSQISTQAQAIMQDSALKSQAVLEESAQSEIQNKITCSEKEDKLQEYETQFFGFTPKSFVSGIYNAVSEYFMAALQIIEDHLTKEYSDLMPVTETAGKMTAIRKHLVKKIDESFDTLEVYLESNIFCVPPSVVLPEDQVQVDAPVTQAEHDKLLQDIETMTKKIIAVKLANDIMTQQIAHMLEVQDTFDTIIESLDDVQATVRQEGVVDLRDSLNHCAQNVLGTLRILKSIDLDTESEPPQAKREKSST